MTYYDDDRDYIWDSERAELDLDTYCPFEICEGVSGFHDMCAAISERRIETYVEEQPQDTGWFEDFKNRWKFWEYCNPTTTIGDKSVVVPRRVRIPNKRAKFLRVH